MLHRYFFTSPSLLYQQCTPNPTLTLCDSSTRRIANQEKRIIAITFSTINCRSSYNLIISCFFTCCFLCWLIKFSFIACKSEKFYQVASTWDQYNKQKINPFIQRLLETQWTWPTSKGRWEAARKISIHGETPWGSETEPCVAINDTLQNLKSAKFAS